MADYNYCCGEDGHGLSYPGFSAIFIQTFHLHHSLSFCVDENAVVIPKEESVKNVTSSDNCEGNESADKSSADAPQEVEKDIVDEMKEENLWIKYVPQNIEKQIFTLSADHEKLETR